MVNRRRTIWAPFNASDIAMPAVGTILVNLGTLIDVARPGLGEYTITRTIGSIVWNRDGVTETARAPVFAGLVTGQRTDNVTSLSDPFNEGDASWLWWKGGLLPRPDFEIPNWIEWSFDALAQRRQPDMQRQNYMMLSNRGIDNVIVSVYGRVLLKLM